MLIIVQRRSQLADVNATLSEFAHLLDVKVHHLHATGRYPMDLTLLVQEDVGYVRTYNLLVDFEESYKLDSIVQVLNHLQLQPHWEYIARLVTSEN